MSAFSAKPAVSPQSARAAIARRFLSALEDRNVEELASASAPALRWFQAGPAKAEDHARAFFSRLGGDALQLGNPRPIPQEILSRLPKAAVEAVLGVELGADLWVFLADVDREGNEATVGLAVGPKGAVSLFDPADLVPMLQTFGAALAQAEPA